jgi:Zn-dependent protease
MEVIGTVVLPLLAIFLGLTGSALAGFIIGWGKPVPVNLNNLSKPRLHDSLIAMAGPAMNLLLAAIIMGAVKFGIVTKQYGLSEIAYQLVTINLVLCFFNLLPIPPLDGSHLLLNATGMSYETYYRLAQYGFIFVIIALQIPAIRRYLFWIVDSTTIVLGRMWGL